MTKTEIRADQIADSAYMKLVARLSNIAAVCILLPAFGYVGNRYINIIDDLVAAKAEMAQTIALLEREDVLIDRRITGLEGRATDLERGQWMRNRSMLEPGKNPL